MPLHNHSIQMIFHWYWTQHINLHSYLILYASVQTLLQNKKGKVISLVRLKAKS